jgi:hypothetical protein
MLQKLGDELWVEVICQTNLEIACSPRNSFRASLMFSNGGRALDGLGGFKLTKPNQTPNANTQEYGSRTMGDEFHGREGNKPRPSAKVPKCVLSGKRCEITETARRLA